MDGSVWVILPTYNEAENIEAVVGGIRAAAPDVRILVVDDNSRDGTGRAGRPARRRRPAPPGQAGARARLHGGLRPRAAATARTYVCEMDADLSHDPADLPRLIAPGARAAPISCSARATCTAGASRTGTCTRRFISIAGCEYARRVLGVQIRDLTGGFKCFRATTLQRIDARSAGAQGYAFQVELTYRTLLLGLRVVEVPIRFRERRLGESKMSAQIALEAAWRVPALRHGPRRWRPLEADGLPADPLTHEG